MSEPGAKSDSRWWHRLLLTGVALGLGLMCAITVSGTASLTASDMGLMTVSMNSASALTGTVSGAAPDVMAGMCDGVCFTGTMHAVCAVVAVAGPLTLLVLLLTRRRNPYLGLLARTTRPFLVRRERRRWSGWSVLSPVTLCVFRV